MKRMLGLNDMMAKPEAFLLFPFGDIIFNFGGVLVHCGQIKADAVSC